MNSWLGATGMMPLLELSTFNFIRDRWGPYKDSNPQEGEERESIRKCKMFSRGAEWDLFQTSERAGEEVLWGLTGWSDVPSWWRKPEKSEVFGSRNVAFYWKGVGGWAYPLGRKFNSSMWTAVLRRVLEGSRARSVLPWQVTGHQLWELLRLGLWW